MFSSLIPSTANSTERVLWISLESGSEQHPFDFQAKGSRILSGDRWNVLVVVGRIHGTDGSAVAFSCVLK